ncbi:hypothetical protein BT96DRAFT_1025259 [Gymnopus androsaceus JB14]|uniref:Uncharacterized protein n=1 Tax=Gymnopus androsaceus JB14 TaxID=1447944 RepID=A0A6A4GT20_9AGAR|nr:hypothetical protein BT96DRAFT_1025259 [Gymnopus androsaceus JB14]
MSTQIHLYDDDELESASRNWNIADWIGCGQVFPDIMPPVIEHQRKQILQIPIEFQSLLPASNVSLEKLIGWSLPPVAGEDHAKELYFTEDQPDTMDAEALNQLTVPCSRQLALLEEQFGQNWFDGKHSLCFFRVKKHLPFWVLTFFACVRVAYFSQTRWAAALDWLLDPAGETQSEYDLAVDVNDAMASNPWTGPIPATQTESMDDLALVLGNNALTGGVVNAMLELASRRLQTSTRTSGGTHLQKLLFIVHSPPFHWIACSIDFVNGFVQFGDGFREPAPQAFVTKLLEWLFDGFSMNFEVRNDLDCGEQNDSYSCPIIAVNAVEHDAFGDDLWVPETARVSRIKVFLKLLGREVTSDFSYEPLISTTNPSSVLASKSSNPSFSSISSANPPSVPSHIKGKKRLADTSMETENSPKKQKVEPSKIHPFFPTVPKKPEGFRPSSPSGKPKKPVTSAKVKKAKAEKDGENRKKLSTLLLLEKEAKKAYVKETLRLLLVFLRSLQRSGGTFRTRLMIFGGSSRLDINDPSGVFCLTCESRVAMKEPYNTARWKAHLEKCKGPNPKKKVTKLTAFESFQPLGPAEGCHSNIPPPAPPPPMIRKPCPGITKCFEPRVEQYLKAVESDGGGSKSVGYFSKEIFDKEYNALTKTEQNQVRAAVAHGWTWRNHYEKGVEAVFACGENPCECFLEIEDGSEDLLKSAAPCNNCILVHRSSIFQKALNKKRADSKTKKFIPDTHVHSKLQIVYKQFKGLETLVTEAEETTEPLLLRYVHHVLKGNFDGCNVFKGLVEAMVLGTDRELKGKGTQNFKYMPEYDDFMNILHDMSPRVYRMFSTHFKTRSNMFYQRRASQLELQIVHLNWLRNTASRTIGRKGYPLALAVDDTKLFATLAPVFDSKSKTWRLIGTVGETSLIIPDFETYQKTVRENTHKYDTATKVRLWALQIPIPSIPGLIVLAVLPISSLYKAPELAKYQTTLLQGLTSRGYGVISMAADGAAVERDCQRRSVSGVAKEEKLYIRYPDGSRINLSITYYSLNGQFFTLAQDSLHLRKTACNNSFTGARLLILGDFVIHYQQIHDLAIQPDSPLYKRDVIKYDKQDDNAAARMFSSHFLAHSSQDPITNMGLIIYLFVFGEFVDAFQSRDMAHYDQAVISIRTLLFLQTWQKFLAKMDYPKNRHFISPAAYDICVTCANSLLALIILPDFIEHFFAELRKLIPDFNMQQALLSIPKLGRMSKATTGSSAKFSKPTYKKTANGYSHVFLDDQKLNFDYELLRTIPSDVEFSRIYKTAVDENYAIWGLLQIHHPDLLESSLATPSPSSSSDPEENEDDEDEMEDEEGKEDEDVRLRMELQQVIDQIDATTHLTASEDNQLDAYELANLALSIQELAEIGNLPEEDPQKLKSLQAEIARAISAHPQAMIAILQHASSSLQQPSQSEEQLPSPPNYQLEEIVSNDLEPLISIRMSHQTIQAATAGKTQIVSERQKLAMEMGSILRHAEDRGSSTGLNRKVRWTGESSATPTAGGNTANAEIAAKGRASQVIKRRRTAFSKNTSLANTISEAFVDKSNPVENGKYGFVWVKKIVFLARVITIYAKKGGKGGGHSWVSNAESIGAPSFISVQIYESHGRGRIFNTVHRKYATAVGIGLRRYSHVPSNAFLLLLSHAEITEIQNGLRVSESVWKIYEKLSGELEGISKAISSLNKRRGKARGTANEAENDSEDDDLEQ